MPIQRSIDIAVPLGVAWEEWIALEALPEGVHTVVDIERDGPELTGRIAGPRGGEWAAEVLDEREGRASRGSPTTVPTAPASSRSTG